MPYNVERGYLELPMSIPVTCHPPRPHATGHPPLPPAASNPPLREVTGRPQLLPATGHPPFTWPLAILFFCLGGGHPSLASIVGHSPFLLTHDHPHLI